MHIIRVCKYIMWNKIYLRIVQYTQIDAIPGTIQSGSHGCGFVFVAVMCMLLFYCSSRTSALYYPS